MISNFLCEFLSFPAHTVEPIDYAIQDTPNLYGFFNVSFSDIKLNFDLHICAEITRRLIWLRCLKRKKQFSKD